MQLPAYIGCIPARGLTGTANAEPSASSDLQPKSGTHAVVLSGARHSERCLRAGQAAEQPIYCELQPCNPQLPADASCRLLATAVFAGSLPVLCL